VNLEQKVTVFDWALQEGGRTSIRRGGKYQLDLKKVENL